MAVMGRTDSDYTNPRSDSQPVKPGCDSGANPVPSKRLEGPREPLEGEGAVLLSSPLYSGAWGEKASLIPNSSRPKGQSEK